MVSTGFNAVRDASSVAGGKTPLRRALGAGRDAEWSDRELLRFDDTLFERSKIHLLTPEGRVLLHLGIEGSMPVMGALPIAGTSYRGFYAVIERLRAAGLVVTVKDPDDHRVRRLSLRLAGPTSLYDIMSF